MQDILIALSFYLTRTFSHTYTRTTRHVCMVDVSCAKVDARKNMPSMLALETWECSVVNCSALPFVPVKCATVHVYCARLCVNVPDDVFFFKKKQQQTNRWLIWLSSWVWEWSCGNKQLNGHMGRYTGSVPKGPFECLAASEYRFNIFIHRKAISCLLFMSSMFFFFIMFFFFTTETEG